MRFVVLTNETPKNKLAGIVSEARQLEIRRQTLKAEYEASLAKLNEAYEKRIADVVSETNSVMDEAAIVVSDFRDELFTNSKTLKFADGEVSIRLGNKAVVTTKGADKQDVIDELRKKGLLNKTTTQPERVLAKTKIIADPTLVESCKTLRVEQRERVSVKLPDNAGKLEHDLPTPPFRRDLA